jgi:hypothetical protein
MNNDDILSDINKLKEKLKKKEIRAGNSMNRDIWPKPLGPNETKLTPQEQKVYLRLSVEYELLSRELQDADLAEKYWLKILPRRLEKYGITHNQWLKILNTAEYNMKLQLQLGDIYDKMDKR